MVFLHAEAAPANVPVVSRGALTLYGLFGQARSETIGFPLEADEGLLVTFPADTLHEVTRVDAGKRYTIVTWFVESWGLPSGRRRSTGA